MKTKILFIALIFSSFVAKAQQREILDWNFFRNDRPAGAQYQAFTWGNLSYRYRFTLTGGEKIQLTFVVESKMDTAKSYFDKKQLNNTRLLEHEQGHADINFIHAMKLKEAFASTSFSAKNYQTEIKDIWNRIYAEMNNMHLKYDEETNHYKEVKAQKKWDQYFSDTIASFH